MALQDLIHHKRQFDATFAKFKELVNILKGEAERNNRLVAPDESEDGLSIAMNFTDTKIECRYSYVNEKGWLAFGFISKNRSGKKFFNRSGSVAFNDQGNILDDQKGISFSLNNATQLDDWFFPQISKALELSWKHKKAE